MGAGGLSPSSPLTSTTADTVRPYTVLCVVSIGSSINRVANRHNHCQATQPIASKHIHMLIMAFVKVTSKFKT